MSVSYFESGIYSAVCFVLPAFYLSLEWSRENIINRSSSYLDWNL